MRKLIAITLLAGLALASPGQAGFLKTWALPDFTGTNGSTNGNPYTYADGNTWGAYSADRDTQSTFTLLAWSDGIGCWASGNAQYWPNIYGGWNGTPKIRGDATSSGVGVLTFAPGTAGVYSLTGTAAFYQTGAGWSSTMLRVIKISGGSTTELYNEGRNQNVSVDLSIITALQDITLATGDTLAFEVLSTSGGTFGEVRLTDAGIGLVPEPASLGLLALGGLALARRRR